MLFQITAKDMKDLRRFDNMLGALGGHKMKLAEVRAVTHTGNKARTAVVRALADVTGLSQKNVRKYLGDPKPPTFADMRYVISVRGSDVPLRLFKARETGRGVTASPFGQRKTFEGSFIKGGRFPSRVDLGMGGNVFEREGSARLGIVKVKSGVSLPIEAMKGEPRAAFNDVVKSELPKRMAHEITRISGGMFS